MCTSSTASSRARSRSSKIPSENPHRFMDTTSSPLRSAEGSPAAAAGIKKGQLIHKVQDKSLRSPRDFNEAVATLEGPITLQTNLGPFTVK